MAAFVAESAFSKKFDASVEVPAIGSLAELYDDLPAPTCEVLVKVMASSVNPSDVSPHVQRYPKVLGSDMAGVVTAVGDGCTRLKVGDAVWGDIGANAVASSNHMKTKELGGYAEYVVALESQLGLKPDNVSFIECGALPKVALTSWKALAWYAGALNDTLWQRSPSVVVLGGSGGCGTTGIQLAVHFGAGNVTTTTSADNFAYCKDLGASTVIDYRATNWWDVIEDDSVDVIYDTVGQDGTGERAMQKLRVGGYYVTITGQTASRVKPGVHQAMFINSDTNLDNLKQMDALSALVAAGKLRMPHIDGIFSLSEVAAAFKVSEGGQVKGKLSISVCNASITS
jgi:NADPH:quinone reductase-like Zn-dependent oxidoreductase